MSLKRLLEAQKTNLSLLIGNGINQYRLNNPENSWKGLLVSLGKRYIDQMMRDIPSGISLTEFYDLLELTKTTGSLSGNYQLEFCTPMRSWIPSEHHKWIADWAIATDSPILTTNFDQVLARAVNASMFSMSGIPFTDFYPWNKYFGLRQLERPDVGFGIWHINGTIHYQRSIRLGLTHYMGCVERARTWLHRGEENTLFRGKNVEGWAGYSTWLHIIFNKPLLIFGLSLEENEVFLRWLLIERAKYFKKFPERRQGAWYAHVSDISPGKDFFLKRIGVTPLKFDLHDDIYSQRVWASE